MRSDGTAGVGEFDTSRNVSEEEIAEWAARRADDAGFLARKLIFERSNTGGYADAFYELAKMLDIPAQTSSPKDVWEGQMLPKLREALANAG